MNLNRYFFFKTLWRVFGLINDGVSLLTLAWLKTSIMLKLFLLSFNSFKPFSFVKTNCGFGSQISKKAEGFAFIFAIREGIAA